MRKLFIIGIGAGNPDFLTVQAIKALSGLDVVFLIDKGREKAALAKLRTEICARYIDNKAYRVVEVADPERDRSPVCYETAIATWHAKRAAIYERMIREELADGQQGAFLVWGDPCLYDSTLRIVDQVAALNEAIGLAAHDFLSAKYSAHGPLACSMSSAGGSSVMP